MSDKPKISMFSPVNGAHAIVESVFFVYLTPIFSPQTLSKIIHQKNKFDDFFPIFNQLQHLDIKFQQSSQKVLNNEITPSIGGIEFQRFKSDGSLEWMLRANRDAISIHCLNYSQWDIVWSKAESLFNRLLEAIGESEYLVTSVGIKYLDWFVYDADIKNYDISQLFNLNSDLVFSKAFSTSPLWHNHVGWFENIDESTPECLHQLKLDSVKKDASGESSIIVALDHTATLRMSPSQQQPLSSYAFINEADSKLSHFMSTLHLLNKKVLGSILVSDIKRQINLGKEFL